MQLSVIRKLRKTHQPFHIHGSNHPEYKVFSELPFMTILEVSFVLKEGNTFGLDSNFYPDFEVDHQTIKEKKDYLFGPIGLLDIFNN